MLGLKLLFAFGAICSFLAHAAHCDTSYYEKYYSARRFVPLKKTSRLQVNFTLDLEAEKLLEFERVALVGDLDALGGWQADKAILLNKTAIHGQWLAQLQLPANSSFNYRYFIAAQDTRSRKLQIRRWESALNARHLELASRPLAMEDRFGYISGSGKEVQRGWLNAGHMVQFQLFHAPLKLNASLDAAPSRLRLKLTPVDPLWRQPIVASARASLEYVRMEYGNSFLQQQPEYGVIYEDNEIVIYQLTLSELENVAYLFQLYVENVVNETIRVAGYQYVQPDVLQGSEGEFNVSLLSPTWMSVIGSLALRYVVINPLPQGKVDFRTSFKDYWRPSWVGLEAGHRGLGKSLTESSTAAAPITENTVATMIAAGELGADIVEFDVQLTKDLVPIISHDFVVHVCMESKTPRNKDDLTQVLIKDITYEQLKDLTTYQVVSNKIIEYPSHNSVKDENLRLFPTFEDFLTKINKSVGFDIEIKWPQLKSDGEWESLQTIDKNVYIDRILEVMMRSGCGRLSFFTSFDANICTLLRYKQNMYPVMFLSASVERKFVDPRSDTLVDTINNAQAFELAGIAPHSKFIKAKPQLIELTQRQQQKVFVWGGDLKDRDSINWFKAQGATGVIYDRMDLHMPPNRTSIFARESDLPEFFQLQCSRNGTATAANATVTEILSNVNML